jgi:hypothetical protein
VQGHLLGGGDVLPGITEDRRHAVADHGRQIRIDLDAKPAPLQRLPQLVAEVGLQIGIERDRRFGEGECLTRFGAGNVVDNCINYLQIR